MRKKTIRKLPPLAREVAKLSNDAASLARKLRNLCGRINDEPVRRRFPELLKPTGEPAKRDKNLRFYRA